MSNSLDPLDCSPPGSCIHGILQGGILEGGTIYSSRGASRPRDRIQVSRIAGRFFTDWATREAPSIVSQRPLTTVGERLCLCYNALVCSGYKHQADLPKVSGPRAVTGTGKGPCQSLSKLGLSQEQTNQKQYLNKRRYAWLQFYS